ncbi:uncharacterized protein EDB91DRAFT_1329769 [Suillus paluster]|uniref:uncharacterized protein n=1 Tax=Suillus paluster TaxID=48578 RepID=UPI001B864F3E|nr:uncharacterized protein EDB91DRAFT_1329769 [Suillus paluster]KAG1735612.1 hypothetical protein EDB91DRAFT_1329769 [Suillus paluster]
MLLSAHAPTSVKVNCLAPIVKVIHDNFGIEEALSPPFMRRCTVAKVVPSLNRKITGLSFRVPVLNVSVVDLVVPAAHIGPLKGIAAYTDDAVVSTDFLGHPASAIFDAGSGIISS